MYLSFDEAGTHVACKSFRLVTAVYDEHRTKLLGTTVSPPVRVLANNDVPTGAAHLQLMVNLPASWEGWASAVNPIEVSYAQRFAAVMASPSPPKSTPRRKSAGKATQYESDDEFVSSDDDHAANTPLRMSTGAATAAQYQNAGAAYYPHRQQEAAPSPSPICLSTGNSPSSLLVEATMGRMTPPMEVVSQPHTLQAEGSLQLWLEQEAKAAAAAAANPANQTTRQPYIVSGQQPHIAKRPKVGTDADAPLPHCPDYEPHFPVLLGPSSSNYHHQNQQQQYHQNSGYQHHVADHHHHAGAAPHHAVEDPVAAFVELMMMQTQQHSEPPVVELPALSGQHEQQQAMTPTAAQAALLEKLVGAGFARAISPSPMLPMHMPEATASVATPTPSALDDLFAGVHATFDALQEAAAVHDDATFPPTMKSPFTHHPSAYTVNVDATVR